MFTIVGDPHAKPDNLDKINTLFNMVEDLGNPVIWLGDLLDTKEMVRGKCLNNYLRRFKQSKLKHYVLVGNHDWFSLECQEHSLEPLKELSNVQVIDKKFHLGNLIFIPYMNDRNTLKELLSKQYCKDAQLFLHADVVGCDYGNGFISEEGLDSKDFVAAKRVISGHYHKYQVKGNLTYLGTPFSHSFGESNQIKYIGLYDSDEDVLELIETPFPKHVTIELDCSKSLTYETNDTDHFRMILRGTQESINSVKRLENVRYIEQPTQSAKQSVVSETDSPAVQFKKWSKGIKDYSYDVVNLGLEVLRSV